MSTQNSGDFGALKLFLAHCNFWFTLLGGSANAHLRRLLGGVPNTIFFCMRRCLKTANGRQTFLVFPVKCMHPAQLHSPMLGKERYTKSKADRYGHQGVAKLSSGAKNQIEMTVRKAAHAAKHMNAIGINGKRSALLISKEQNGTVPREKTGMKNGSGRRTQEPDQGRQTQQNLATGRMML